MVGLLLSLTQHEDSTLLLTVSTVSALTSSTSASVSMLPLSWLQILPWLNLRVIVDLLLRYRLLLLLWLCGEETMVMLGVCVSAKQTNLSARVAAAAYDSVGPCAADEAAFLSWNLWPSSSSLSRDAHICLNSCQ